MRSVINISLPPQMARDVEKEVKSGRYASKSEFFRTLLREWREDRWVEKNVKLERVPNKEITKEMRANMKRSQTLDESHFVNI